MHNCRHNCEWKCGTAEQSTKGAQPTKRDDEKVEREKNRNNTKAALTMFNEKVSLNTCLYIFDAGWLAVSCVSVDFCVLCRAVCAFAYMHLFGVAVERERGKTAIRKVLKYFTTRAIQLIGRFIFIWMVSCLSYVLNLSYAYTHTHTVEYGCE